jgi:hypothetical protein
MRLGEMKSVAIFVLMLGGGTPFVNAQPQPTAPTPAPLPLGVDGQLASWLQVRGEFRTRIEGFTGGGFDDNDDAYWMDRFRFNATVRPSRSFALVVQAQDARAFRKAAGSRAAPFRDTLDLRMAYAEIGAGGLVRVGRQELAFGEQRLLGHLNWANTARSFDGIRTIIKNRFGQIDGFAASVVSIDPQRFDTSGRGNVIAGTYVSLDGPAPAQVVEPYFFWRRSPNVIAESGGVGHLHQGTSGVRSAGKAPWALDYSAEVSVQTGSVGTDDIAAWAGHGTVGKTLAGTPGRPRFFGEYNYASGDDDATDGTRGTFDQLYPTGHDKLGLSDQVGWKNVHNARIGVEFRAASRWSIAGSYHSWWLSSAADGLYNASGALVARSTTGTAGRHVGQEIDGQLVYSYSPQLQIGGGYAQLLPGQFLENTTPGRSYRFPYVMVTYVFLGEQPAIGRRTPQ